MGRPYVGFLILFLLPITERLSWAMFREKIPKLSSQRHSGTVDMLGAHAFTNGVVALPTAEQPFTR